MTVHKPVLMKEVIEALNPHKNQNFVDCTIGGGGHAEAILSLTGPNGKVLGLDWDKQAITRTRERLAKYASRLVLVNESYIEIKQAVYDKKFNKIDGILFDLGLSSDQLQDSGRGFSFQVNEPLDMRYDAESNPLTAEHIVNTYPLDKLTNIFRENAEEESARKIATAICETRKQDRLKTTLELVGLIVRTLPRKKSRIHPATKVFQALRMEVNNELANIRMVLKDITQLLEPGARVAVIAFHSIEDRIIKEFFRHEATQCHCPKEIPVCRCEHRSQYKIITKKPIVPSEEEIIQNFRCRSAKLRVAEKI
jgi:16S rRNA (cytosine1402-N4)-methyltransferase